MKRLACHHFDSNYCRSCGLLAHVSDFDESAEAAASRLSELKTEEALRILQPILRASTKVAPTYAPFPVFSSRAKAKAAVGSRSRRITLGLLDEEFRGKTLTDCPLHYDLINQILAQTQRILNENPIAPYNVKSRTGELKHVLVTSNSRQNQAIVRFVVHTKTALEPLRQIGARLQEAIPAVTVVSANIQPLQAAILEGPEEVILSGGAVSIAENYSGIHAVIRPQSFLQVTPETATGLYHDARRLAREFNPKRVLDLYCGSGVFSFATAENAESHLGAEISPEAIACADEGKLLNALPQLTFTAANVEKDEFWQTIPFEPDLIIANPPRRGLVETVRKQIRKKGAKQLLYSSCNPETLARDVLELNGDVQYLRPFDMFPLTSHMEVLALVTL